MMNLKLSRRDGPLKVLCLGAHSDDIEIGCGGTVLKLISEQKKVRFHWIVLSANGQRRSEARAGAEAFLAAAEHRTVIVKGFKDGFFPYIGDEIKTYFEELKRKIDPDLIFTHHRLDLHQDHRLVSELTWNTFRDHLILEYEVPKYDADLRAPNVFSYLDQKIRQTKLRLIIKHFQSQADNQWFTEETFRAILRLRGVESNAPTRYAEAFYCRKAVLF
jgi:LmbE family N-acetylglucosaminyl deacetylase